MPESLRTCAARPDDEHSDPTCRVRLALRVLRCKTLVDMIVTPDDDIGAGFVERLKEAPHPRVVAVPARAEQRVMPEG